MKRAVDGQCLFDQSAEGLSLLLGGSPVEIEPEPVEGTVQARRTDGLLMRAQQPPSMSPATR